MEQRNFTLLTDLCELVMIQGYSREKDANETVVFDMFYRTNLHSNDFAICVGLQQVIEYIENLHLDDSDIEYLRSLDVSEEGFPSCFRELRFVDDIRAIPGETVVFPREPLVKATAPITQAQFTKTALPNIINRQSFIVTKTERTVHAARDDDVMEFGLHRARGPDVDTYGVGAAMIVECIGASNVLYGKMFDVLVKGTHVHNWIMSSPDKLAAFRIYAKPHPSACILLVDTYGVLGPGIPSVTRIFKEMKGAGIPLASYGIHPGNDDLAYLSRKAKKMLNEVGFPGAVTFTSSDLDENLINSLKMQGATTNSRSVGTSLTIAKGCPFFGGIYRLATVMDKATGQFVPKIRLSENAEKITNPSNKTIQRVYDRAIGKIIVGLICLVGKESDICNSLLPSDPLGTRKKTMLIPDSCTMRELMIPISPNGGYMYQSPRVMGVQTYCKRELDILWDESKRLVNLYTVHMGLSNGLQYTKDQPLDSYHRKQTGRNVQRPEPPPPK